MDAVRVEKIAANADPNSAETYAAYTYLGAGTVVEMNYPAVGGNGLKLTYKGVNAGYSGFDRFGRIVWQRWMRTSGSDAVDRYFYGYDRNSNRIWRAERKDANDDSYRDEAYAYDRLDRLVGSRRGLLPDKPYQAPIPGDTDKDGDVDMVDRVKVIGNFPTSSGATWEDGDFDGDGDVDYSDYQVANSRCPMSPAPNFNDARSWTLDPLGNWDEFKMDDDSNTDWDVLDQDRAHNKVNEIDTDDDHANDPGNSISGTPNWIDPTYDAAGNVTSGPKPGAAATRLHFVYDAWNRLAAVKDDNNGEPDETLVEYRYDGLHRRVRKIDKTGQADVTYDYYHNTAWQVLEVRRDGNSHPLKQYVWDLRYIDSPVVRFQDGNQDGDCDDIADHTDSVLYYTNDGNFNVTALVDANDGSVVERYWYTPYGKVTVLNGAADLDPGATEWEPDPNGTSDWDNEILYCGYRYDWVTSLYHVRFRYYHPTLGRWMQRDPIGYVDEMNIYGYVLSSPPRGSDPSGLQLASFCEECPDQPLDPSSPGSLASGGTAHDYGLRNTGGPFFWGPSPNSEIRPSWYVEREAARGRIPGPGGAYAESLDEYAYWDRPDERSFPSWLPRNVLVEVQSAALLNVGPYLASLGPRVYEFGPGRYLSEHLARHHVAEQTRQHWESLFQQKLRDWHDQERCVASPYTSWFDPENGTQRMRHTVETQNIYPFGLSFSDYVRPLWQLGCWTHYSAARCVYSCRDGCRICIACKVVQGTDDPFDFDSYDFVLLEALRAPGMRLLAPPREHVRKYWFYEYYRACLSFTKR